MSDLFVTRDVKPMLIGAEVAPFDSDRHIFELKWDGFRCMAYLGGDTDLRNKRNIKVGPLFPELAGLCRQVGQPCILDGEVVVLREGRPDFEAVRRRTLMGSPFRIELAAAKLPASFVAYDILYLAGQDLTGRPLMERKALLSKTVAENERMAVARYVEGQGRALFDLTVQQGLEGIVAKRREGRYLCGKRTKTEWQKIKNMQDDDFVVCGFIHKADGKESIILGQYDADGSLRYQGHVTSFASKCDFRRIEQAARLQSPAIADVPAGHGNERTVWLEPELVCRVEFMHRTANGGLRQPVFRGLREDKTAEECRVFCKNCYQ